MSDAAPAAGAGPLADHDSPAAGVHLYHGDAADAVPAWPEPDVVVCDPPYGLGGFDDDPETTGSGLVEYYDRFVGPITDGAGLGTQMWWWSSEESWAWAHQAIDGAGWEYRGFNIWNKGVSHVAGRTDTETMRKFPVVTEACVHYRLDSVILDGELEPWRRALRSEWERAGLAFSEADEACGVANAASRKYLAADDKWYPPPVERFEDMVEYANEHGNQDGAPYFSDDAFNGVGSLIRGTDRMTGFDLEPGVTNVWDHHGVTGADRVDVDGDRHIAQKPMGLVDRILSATTDPGDVVWAPFGGVYTTAAWCAENGRRCYSAEVDGEFHEAGVGRVRRVVS